MDARDCRADIGRPCKRRGQRPERGSTARRAAAGQAAAVAHVAAHELGAAAYAIKAARAAAPEPEGDSAGRLECLWQRDQLPEAIRELVLDDQRLRTTSAGQCLTAESGAGAPGRQHCPASAVW